MSRTEEVEVLRFFETGPIDKVEAVFNIVCDKMRERLRERTGSTSQPVSKRRKRRGENEEPAQPQES